MLFRDQKLRLNDSQENNRIKLWCVFMSVLSFSYHSFSSNFQPFSCGRRLQSLLHCISTWTILCYYQVFRFVLNMKSGKYAAFVFFAPLFPSFFPGQYWNENVRVEKEIVNMNLMDLMCIAHNENLSFPSKIKKKECYSMSFSLFFLL